MKHQASHPSITEIGARLLAEAETRSGLTHAERYTPEMIDKMARLVRIGRDRVMDAEGGSRVVRRDAAAA